MRRAQRICSKRVERVILSLVLAITLVMNSCLPVMASPSGGIVSITAFEGGNGGNAKGAKETIYFGNYWQDYKGSGDMSQKENYTKSGIQWRVLSNDTSGTGKMFLLSDKALYADRFSMTNDSIAWWQTEIRGTLNSISNKEYEDTTRTKEGFAKDAFSDSEWNAINATYHKDGLTASYDKLFILNQWEVTETKYGFISESWEETETRQLRVTTFAKNVKMYGNGKVVKIHDNGYCHWWLRAREGSGECTVSSGNVDDKGRAGGSSANRYEDRAVRPALNLDQSQVVFLTSARCAYIPYGTVVIRPTGKSVVNPGGGFTLEQNYDGSQGWKLTLRDTSIATPTIGALTLDAAGTSTLGYSGASTGTNKYVSAVLQDSSGSYVNYAKLADASSASSGTGTLGKGTVADGTYNMYIYGEQANGEYLTDYASNFTSAIPVTFTNGVMTGMTLGTAYTDTANEVTLKNNFALTLRHAVYCQDFTISGGNDNKIIGDPSGSQISGVFYVASGSGVTLSGSLDALNSFVILNGTMNVDVTGTTTISGGINTVGSAGGTLNVASGRTVTLSGSEDDKVKTLGNQGTVTINKANAETTVTLGTVTGDAGVLNITQGTVNITGDVMQNKITNETAGTLRLLGNSVSLTNDLANSGTLNFSGTSTTINNAITGTGITMVGAGTDVTLKDIVSQSKITNNGLLNISGSSVSVTNGLANEGVLKFSANSTTVNSAITGTGVTVIDSGNAVTLNGTITQSEILNGGTLNISGSSVTTTGGLTNYGALNFTGASTTVSGDVVGYDTSTVTVNSGKVVTLKGTVALKEITNDGTLNLYGAGTSYIDKLVNKGTVTISKDATANSVTLYNVTDDAGTLNITKGTVTIDGNLTQKEIKNNDTLTFNGTSTVNGTITGTGTTVINSGKSVTLNDNFTQNRIKNDGALVFNGTSTVNGDIMGGGTTTINSSEAVTLSGNVSQKEIKNGGALTFNGTSIFYGDITGGGTVTINKDKTLTNLGTIDNAVTNNGTFNTFGEISKAISGTGKLNLKDDTTITALSSGVATVTGQAITSEKQLSVASSGLLDSSDTLTLSSGARLDTTTGATTTNDTTTLNDITVKSFTANSGSYWDLDLVCDDDGKTGTAITLSADTITANSTGILKLGNIKYAYTTNNPWSEAGQTKTVKVIGGDATNLTIEGTSFAAAGYKYDVSQDTSDKTQLKVTRADYDATLADIVSNNTVEGYEAGNINTYHLTKDLTDGAAGDDEWGIGTLTRTSSGAVRNLAIYGHNYKITPSGKNTDKFGILVDIHFGAAEQDSLELVDLTMEGFNDALYISIDTSAKLKGVTFSNSVVDSDKLPNILNEGTLTFYGAESTLDKGIAGDNGTTEITENATVNVAGDIEQTAIVIDNGSTLNLNSTSETTELRTWGRLRNDGTLNLSGTSEVTVNSNIVGTGTTVIGSSKKVTLNGALSQGTITNDGILNLSDPDNGTSSIDTLTNNGEINLTGTKYTGEYSVTTLANKGKVTINKDDTANSITLGTVTDNTGVLNITKGIVNITGDVAQNTITNGDTLNISGNSVTATAGLVNTGILTFNGASTTVNNAITGEGTTAVSSGATVYMSDIDQNIITNSGKLTILSSISADGGLINDGTLNFTGTSDVTISSAISGSGSTAIAEYKKVILSGDVSQNYISNDGELTILGSSVTANNYLINNAILNFGNGTDTKQIAVTGNITDSSLTGTTSITSNTTVTLNGDVTQNAITNSGTLNIVGSSVSTTNGLANAGTLTFDGSSTTVSGAITGDSGTTTINTGKTVTMNGDVTQDKITNNGTLNISKNLTVKDSTNGLVNASALIFTGTGTTEVSGKITGDGMTSIAADKAVTLNNIITQQVIANSGTLNISGSSSVETTDTNYGLINSGTLNFNVNSGVTGIITGTGTITIAKEVNLNGAVSQGTITNAGKLYILGSSVTTTNGLANAGTLTFDGTSTTVNGAITGDNGTTIINTGKTVTLNDGVTQYNITNNGTLNIAGSYVTTTDSKNDYDLKNLGDLNFTGSTTVSGKITNGGAGGTTNIAENATVTLNDTITQNQITNNGTLNISGSSVTASLANAGTLNLLSGTTETPTTVSGAITGDGAITNSGAATLTSNVTQKAITNDGTLNISKDLTVTDGLTNNSELNFTGTTTFTGDITGDGTVTIASGKNLTNQGTIANAVKNNGTFYTFGEISKAISSDSGTGTLKLTDDTTITAEGTSETAAITNQAITVNNGTLYVDKEYLLDATDDLTLSAGARLDTTAKDTSPLTVHDTKVKTFTSNSGYWDLSIISVLDASEKIELKADTITATTISTGGTLKLGNLTCANDTGKTEWGKQTQTVNVINEGAETDLTIEGTSVAAGAYLYDVEQHTTTDANGTKKYGSLDATRLEYTVSLADIVRNNTVGSSSDYQAGKVNTYQLVAGITIGDDADGIGTLTRTDKSGSASGAEDGPARNFAIYGYRQERKRKGYRNKV